MMVSLGKDIILRKPAPSDADDLLAVKNNAKATDKLVGFKESLYSKDDILNWIEFHNSHPREKLFVIYHKGFGAVIGHVGLYEIDHRVRKAGFGILIGDDRCRGKGYGRLCLQYILKLGFEKLGLNRIELEVLEGNEVAFNLYRKSGFKVEGVHRQSQFKNGRYFDITHMAILR
ncbi:MAG: GNAT family N-acetyltransferase, partial [Rikenellaceae bacterium]|nr:GNAT family N-acetyltransferase [Rikenellaceae bacterium]